VEHSQYERQRSILAIAVEGAQAGTQNPMGRRLSLSSFSGASPPVYSEAHTIPGGADGLGPAKEDAEFSTALSLGKAELRQSWLQSPEIHLGLISSLGH